MLWREFRDEFIVPNQHFEERANLLAEEDETHEREM